MQRFQGWRRRAKHNRNILQMRAHHSHIAGVITQAILLLVRTIMFFINNNNAQFGKGCEQRRARTNHNPRHFIARRQPSVEAFSIVERRVHDFDGDIKTLAKPVDGLWG
ncbi:Uncharacterised protein [Vibrio cholerae]|nr:Uncharacterised protein [Vibrio cholerae]CSD63510.1 Uncharacterised protein [Vibrio cholerae]